MDQGDPCEAFAYYGYKGLEREVVAKVAPGLRSSMADLDAHAGEPALEREVWRKQFA